MNRMNNRTPRLATLALMLAALTACTKTNITPNDDLTNALNPSSGAPIAFETEDAFTKAVIDSKEDLEVEGNKFRVWSWFQGTTSGPMFTKEGTEVEYKKLNEESIPQYGWTYKPTRYWLNGTYDFAAVYPSTVSGEYKPAQTGGTPVLTVKDFDVTTQDDLLVAFNTGIDGGNHPAKVNLSFQHALSCIQLKLTLDENDFFEPTEDGGKRQVGYAFVSIVGFNNIATTGILTASDATNYSLQWGSYGPVSTDYPSRLNGQLRLNYTDEPIEILRDSQNFFGENGLLGIPQELANGNGELYMQVVIYPLGYAGERIIKEFHIPLKSGVSEWEPNTKYIYEGVLTHELVIDFSVTQVIGWTKDTLGGFIVN